MQLVYAAGERDREFHIADGGAEVPAGARVYATCTAEGTVEEIGEVTFGSMTDAEFYELRALAREARGRAAEREAPAAGDRPSLWRRLFGR